MQLLKIKTKNEDLDIGEVLVHLKFINSDQLRKFRAESKLTGKPIQKIIQDSDLVSLENITQAYGISLGIPYINLKNKSIPSEVLYKIPEDEAKKYNFIAFQQEGKQLKVAVLDPKNLKAIESLLEIQNKEKCRIEIFVASEDSINYALNQYQIQPKGEIISINKPGEEKTDLKSKPSQPKSALVPEITTEEIGRALTTEIGKALEEITLDVDQTVGEEVESTAQLGKIIQQAPISKAVATIIKYAVKSRASDIHIEPTDEILRVRYRVDGILQNIVSLPKKVHPAVISRIKILSNLKIDEQRIPQDGRFHSIIDKNEVDFRVSTLPTANGEKVALRILDTSSGILTLEQLGVKKGKGFEILKENIQKPYGMTLVTGPTGSGKTTTLYAILDKLNKVGVNIVTLEDPIEYYISGVNQSQIRPEIGYDFANGLRSIVRQDPDIIMVGEIRDFETAEMATHSALTGHIVLSTLHTNDASGAIPRLIDMKVEPFLVASSVNMVVAQRLVRKICSNCKQKYKPSKEMIDNIKEEIKKIPKKSERLIKFNPESLILYKGKGCARCNQTGYKGRIGIFEILPVDEKIEELTVKKVSASEIQEKATKEGMITMKQDGVLKVLDGITTLEEVMRVASE